MISSIFSGLIAAWVLSFFEIDELFIDFCKRHFNFNVGESTWYVFCVIVSIILFLV